jgi:hypothetical protein
MRRLTSVISIGLLAVGCAGGGGGGEGNEDDGTPDCEPALAPSPLRRLTRAEYDHTIRDLLGDTSAPAQAFPPDENTFGYAVGGAVSVLQAEQFAEAAEALASVASPFQLMLPCQPATDGQDVCASAFIERFGKRAYRRPLTGDEVERLTALYRWGMTEYDYLASLRLVMQAILQSPNFLYRVEAGLPAEAADGAVPLSQYEIASRLSYFLWATMPDDELFAAADAGTLGTPDEIEAQVRRMLADPKAGDALDTFYRQWLGLEAVEHLTKDPVLYPGFTPEAAESMHAETLAFARHLFFEDDGRLETLLRAPYSFVDRRLAPIYGVSVPSDSLVLTDLDPDQRSGILTHAAILAANAKADQGSPIHRGKFVRERLLCQPPPPPPPGMAATVPPFDPDQSTRERFAAHRSDATCNSCHQLLDPIGFGFEHYDTIGQYRTADGGAAIDASGEIVETRDANGAFVGVIELAERLAGSEQVEECVVKQWFRYAMRRSDTSDDECTIAIAQDAFDDAGGDMRELVVALATSEAFRTRLPVEE